MAEEPSMMQMLKQARGLQKQMKQIQKRVDKKEVSAMVADGKIEVVITGKLQVRRILIDQSLLENPDKRVLQDNLTLAMNTAIQKAQNLMASEMQKMAGDLGLPPGALGEATGGGEDDDRDDDSTSGDEASSGGGRLRKWFGR
jgi:DNA-binding YbaB/EbfC family protein